MKTDALRILLNYGSEQALRWGLEMLDKDSYWALVDNFPNLLMYTSKSFDLLAEYMSRATDSDLSKTPRPHPMYESVASVLENIAMESLEMLEKVKSLFRKIADEKSGFKYYNKVADNLDIEYYANRYVPVSLREASEMYYRGVGCMH